MKQMENQMFVMWNKANAPNS